MNDKIEESEAMLMNKLGVSGVIKEALLRQSPTEVDKFSNATLVDTSTWDPETSGYLQGDAIHPSETGAQAIADLFLAQM